MRIEQNQIPKQPTAISLLEQNEFTRAGQKENFDVYQKGKLKVFVPSDSLHKPVNNPHFIVEFDPESKEIIDISKKIRIEPEKYIEILKKGGIAQGWLEEDSTIGPANLITDMKGLKHYSKNVLEQD